jgi:hypothetical protein
MEGPLGDLHINGRAILRADLEAVAQEWKQCWATVNMVITCHVSTKGR